MLRKSQRVGLLVICLGAGLEARAQEKPSLTFDVLFRSEGGGSRATGLDWTPDGRHLSYLWSVEGESALWSMDTASGQSEELVRSSALRLPGEGDQAASISLEEYQWSPDGSALLFQSEGDLFLYTLEGSELSRLTETEATEEDPKFSPDGARLAFVRENDLFVLELGNGREVSLTRDGEEDVTLNGKTDWVYWEEIWGRDSTGFWWSPRGDRIAFYRFDETPVATYPLVDFLHTYPRVVPQKYPKAGGMNPVVAIGVVDLANRNTVWMQTGAGEDLYLARVTWTRGGGALAIHRLNRAQNRLDLLLCAPTDGRCSTLLSEDSSTWIDLEDDFAFLTDGRLVWGSNRSGWRRLYLYDATGRLLRPLTPEDLAVTSLDGVNEEHGLVIYTAHRIEELGAAERQVYRVELDSGRNHVLASSPGWNTASVASGAAHWVHTGSDADTPPRQTLRRADGTVVASLPSRPPTGYVPEALPEWEFLTIPGPEDSRLPARILKPAAFDPGRRYPVVVYHYGCPASQVVENRWGSRSRNLWHKRMAERGYVVFMVDNQGSTFFGKRGAERLHRLFGEVELAAQIAGVGYLKSQPFVDGGRIGLWGWSGGGTNTLYAVFQRPGVWKAAVAGAPVTDWLLYDTIWTERYLGHPEDNPDGYQASSPVTYASQLEDPLLIVHGTADDNVHPHNTLVVTQKLIEAGIPFEEAIYPRQKHGFTGKHLRHFYERMEEFFDRHLQD